MSSRMISQLEAVDPAAPGATACNAHSLLLRSALYREFLAEREEILKLKWIESEKAGHDIGFERALVNWITHHRAGWQKARRAQAFAGA